MHSLAGARQSYMTRKLNQNLFGNKVKCTACSLLVILDISCSKLHCQKGANSILISHENHATNFTPLRRGNFLHDFKDTDLKARSWLRLSYICNIRSPPKAGSAPPVIDGGDPSLQEREDAPCHALILPPSNPTPTPARSNTGNGFCFFGPRYFD